MNYALVVVPEAIDRIRFLLIDDQGEKKEFLHNAMSDEYAKVLKDTFDSLGITPKNIIKAAVVFGGPSATANRLATTLVNGLSFVLSIPVHSFSDATNLADIDTLLENAEIQEFISPVYQKPPNIS